MRTGLVDANAALAAFLHPKPTAQDKPKQDKAPINKKLEERKKNLKARKAQRRLADPEMPHTFQHNLDTTRDNRPARPEGRVKINARQPAGYDDPVPTSTANFPAYFTELTKATNDTGRAGSKPLQQVDPTAGVGAIGGYSINLLARNVNFTAPVLSLAGRAGLSLSLGLSYNSNVWTKHPGTSTMFYNADRGFPAPGWRLGFGAMQGINNSGNIGPYTNSITGKASFLYIQPDGAQRDLAYNSTTNRIVGRTSYDTNGNVRNVADAAGNRKSLDLTDNFTNKPAGLGATNAYPYLAADPAGMKAGAQYNYYTGQSVKTFAQRPNQTGEEQVTTTTYDFADRPLRTTSPTGSYVELGYWDNLLRQTSYAKRDVVNGVDQLVYSWQDFNGAGLVIRKGSDHPNAVTGKYSGQKFKYDALGRGVEQSNVLAVTSSFTIDTSEPGQVGSTQWQWTAAEFDGLGRTAAVEKPDNTYLFNDYSVCGCAGGLVTDNYDERNNRKTTEADFLGRLQYAREYEPQLSYDEFLQVYYISDYLLHAEVEYVYDALDRLTQTIHRSGGGMSSAGKLTGTGQTRSFTYDTWGRAQSETTPEAGTLSYSYTTNDQIATTTNANGKITTVAYNNRNLVTGISYNDTTPSVSYGYDDYGARTSMSDGEGTMSYVYDSLHRLQSETRTFTGLAGKSYQLNYSFNLGGQLNQVTYAALNSASLKPPSAPQHPLGSQVATLGAKPLPRFDKLRGGLSYSLAPVFLRPALTTAFFPASAQGQTSISGYVKRAAGLGGQPIAGATVTCQRVQGNSGPPILTRTTDANGYYNCNGLPQNSSVYYGVSVSKEGWNWTPYSQGFFMSTNRTANFDGTPSSSTTTLSGTVTTLSGQAMSGVTITLTGSQNQTTTSDASGNFSFTVNTLGTYTLVATKSGYEFTPVTLNIGDFVTPQTVSFHGVPSQGSNPPPSGNTFFSQKVNYAYKPTGALASLGTSMIGGDALSATNVIESLSYTAFGAASQVMYGNDRKVALGYSVDTMRLTSLNTTRWNGSDPILTQSYSYTENGLLSNIGDAVDSTYSASYAYNYRNQLVTYGRDQYSYGAWYTKNYSVDDWGNLTGYNDSWGSETTSFTHANNRMSSMTKQGATTNFSYDTAGNMTAAGSTTYTWDAANRLQNVNGGSLGSYGYDGNGKRVKKSESGTTTYYVLSSVLGSVMEVTTAGVQRAYVMREGLTIALLSTDGNFYWNHTDHLGNGRKLTNSAGTMVYRAEFDPYGKLLLEWSSPTGQTNLNTKKFTGYERDVATGLDYAQARMFASEWGRFMTPDPKSGNSGSPHTLNRYAYAHGNPVNLIDPDGLDPISPSCGGSVMRAYERDFGWAFPGCPSSSSETHSKAGIYGGGGGGSGSAGADGQGRGPVVVLPRTGGKSRPFLIVNTVLVPPPTQNSCGDILREARWQIIDRDPMGSGAFTGAVVQHVIFQLTVYTSNSTDAQSPVDFFEAWRLEGGTWTDNSGLDGFQFPPVQPGFRYTFKVTAWAAFIEGEDIIREVSSWGIVPESGYKSKYITNEASRKIGGTTWSDEGKLKREWEIEANCLRSPAQTKELRYSVLY